MKSMDFFGWQGGGLEEQGIGLLAIPQLWKDDNEVQPEKVFATRNLTANLNT